MVCNIYEKWCVPFSFLCYTKHSVDLKGETNNMERRNAWKIYTADQLKELDQINSRYKVCLDEGKTERECVRLTVKEIEIRSMQYVWEKVLQCSRSEKNRWKMV